MKNLPKIGTHMINTKTGVVARVVDTDSFFEEYTIRCAKYKKDGTEPKTYQTKTSGKKILDEWLLISGEMILKALAVEIEV